VHRGAGHVAHGLAQGGQLEDLPRGHRDVVVAEDRHVLGHPHAQRQRGVERTEGDHVVAADDGGRGIGQPEELARVLIAALVGERALAHERRVQGHAALGEDLREPGHAVAARRGVRRPSDDGDPPVTELEQVPAPDDGAPVVVADHAVDVQPVDVAVQQHHGQAALLQFHGEPRPEGGGRDEHPVDGAVQQPAQGLLPGGDVGPLGEQHHPVTHDLQLVVDRRQQRREERVGQVRDDDGDGAGRP
jgi:hypothetical protein